MKGKLENVIIEALVDSEEFKSCDNQAQYHVWVDRTMNHRTYNVKELMKRSFRWKQLTEEEVFKHKMHSWQI